MVLNLSNIEQSFELGDISKRPFVFLHGNSQNRSCGYGVLEFFQSKGHSVFSYDLPGHGLSPMPDHDYQFKDLIDLNLALLEAHQINNPILCGHSLGGMIQAGSIVKGNLKGASLILCGSFDADPSLYTSKYFSETVANQFDKSLDEYINGAFELYQKQQFYDYYANRHLADGAVSLINRQFNHPKASKLNLSTLNDFDCRENLISMKIPALVLHGENEEVIHPELIMQMKIENSAVQLEWYPKGGHYAFYQQDELTTQLLDKHYQHISY
jgi:non-heme chloroperoxidase